MGLRDSHHIGRIAMHPTNASVVFVAAMLVLGVGVLSVLLRRGGPPPYDDQDVDALALDGVLPPGPSPDSDFPGTGWRTDRGRVLILLGEPDAVEKMTGDADSLDREVWTYGLAGQGAGPLRIVFYRGKDGRYRLNPRPVERSAGSAGAIPDRDRESARAQLRFSLPPMTRMAQSVVLDALMGVEPRGGSSVPRSRGRVADSGAANGPSAPPPPRSAIVADGAWYFQAADGSVLALLVVDVIASELLPGDRDLSAIAYLLDADGESNAPGAGGEEIRLTEADAHAGPGVRRFVGRVYLEPGDVRRVRYAFADDERQTMVVRTRRLHAPELGTGGLAFSSIVPSDDLGPLPPGPPTPFRRGLGGRGSWRASG